MLSVIDLADLKGEAGYNATGAAEDAAAVGAFMRGTAGPNDAAAALSEASGLNVRNYGAVGDGVHDDTAAIRAAIADAFPAKTILFPPTGSGEFYSITDTITIDSTRPNIRFKGVPRDGYSVSIRCAVPGKTMFTIKVPGVVFEDIGLIGDSDNTNGGNGSNATVTGIESFGDINGNCDTLFHGVTFQGLATSIRLRARNNMIEKCMFSNCLNGVIIDGLDLSYHTGPFAADQNRGNTIRDNRFHNIGTTSANSAVEFTTTAKVQHAIVKDNFFDSLGFGTHIRAIGTAAAPHERIDFDGNKHTELQAVAYDLAYVNNYELSSARIHGPIAGTYSSDAIRLDNCTNFVVSDINMYRIGRSAIVGTNNLSGDIRGVRANSVGLDPTAGVIGHGLDFNSTNSDMTFDKVRVKSGDGWGFIGDPVNSSMTNCDFVTNLGRISSNTIVNVASSGLNRFMEGGRGRLEDVAVQSYDFTAATAKTVATITVGGTFNTFMLEVEFSGNSAGNAVSYIFARRLINPANGTPTVVTIGTDALALATLAITTAGPQAVNVVITPTNAVFGSVRVKASAGGAANSVNPRGVTVAMA